MKENCSFGFGFCTHKAFTRLNTTSIKYYPRGNGKERHEDSWYFFTSTISLYLFYNLNCHKMALLPHMKKLKPTTITTIGNVSWSFMKSHNNVWQAFLKILDRMEIRQVPWRSQKMNSKWRLHNNWWPFSHNIRPNEEANVPWSSPKKEEARSSHSINTW
jgi:hypothetical protein